MFISKRVQINLANGLNVQLSSRSEVYCSLHGISSDNVKSPWDRKAMPKSRYKNTLDRRWSFLEKIYYIVYLYERSLGRRQAWQQVRLKNEEKSVSYTLESKKPANFHVCWMGKKIKIYYRFSSSSSTWLRDIWLLWRREIRSYTFVCLNQFYSLTICLLCGDM